MNKPHKSRLSGLSIETPEQFQEKKPALSQNFVQALELSDPILDNLVAAQDKQFVDFNFKVPLVLRTDFKKTSASWNMSNKELMTSCYKVWLEKYGRTPEEAQAKLKKAKEG